jgi:AraC-like DNA-binding protein
VLVNRGSCIHQFRERQDVLIPGDCFLVPLHERHAYAISHETEIINCLFRPDVITAQSGCDELWPSLGNLLSPGNAWRIFHLSAAQVTYFRHLLQQIAGSRGLSNDPPEPAADLAARQTGQENRVDLALHDRISFHCLALLLLELVRMDRQASLRRHERLSGSPFYGSDLGRQTVSCLLAYMRQHVQENITVSQLAAQVHLSEGHCRRLFVRYIGDTPKAFLNRLRLDEALSLLEQGGLSVREIAEQVGFADPGYFARYFRKHLHESPSDFLRRVGCGVR